MKSLAQVTPRKGCDVGLAHKRPVWLETGHKLAAASMRSPTGDRRSLMRYVWDVSGDCQSPVVMERHHRPSAPHRRRVTEKQAILHPLVQAALRAFPGAVVDGVRTPAFTEARMIKVARGETPLPVTCEITARCRRCDNCRRYRARKWSARARVEIAKSVRTWFGTITLSDEQYFRLVSVTRARLSRGGTDLEALSTAARFEEIGATIGVELTKYFKRVRKQSQGRLRYILVAEAHTSGKHHYHALVHECDAAGPIRKKVLDRQWRMFGFTKWRLVPRSDSTDVRKAAWYVCKYISKGVLARVRASSRYGQTEMESDGLEQIQPPRNGPAAGAAAVTRRSMTLPSGE